MLRTETALTSRIGRLPDTCSFSKQGFAETRIDTAAIMFGGSEYVKDGLMPITELLGVTPWRARMIGIVDDLGDTCPCRPPSAASSPSIPRSTATCCSCCRGSTG